MIIDQASLCKSTEKYENWKRILIKILQKHALIRWPMTLIRLIKYIKYNYKRYLKLSHLSVFFRRMHKITVRSARRSASRSLNGKLEKWSRFGPVEAEAATDVRSEPSPSVCCDCMQYIISYCTLHAISIIIIHKLVSFAGVYNYTTYHAAFTLCPVKK